MPTIKDRLILGIGLNVIERPRQLQQSAGADEHHVVHCLYSMQKQGLVEFRRRRNAHRPGLNLTAIRLTTKGTERYKELNDAS